MEECTFLGVTLDTKLNFNKHIQTKAKKIGRLFNNTYKNNKFLPNNIVRNLYYTLIYPYLIYCKICNKTFLVYTNVIFKECKILLLNEINTLCVSAYKHKNENNFELSGPHD